MTECGRSGLFSFTSSGSHQNLSESVPLLSENINLDNRNRNDALYIHEQTAKHLAI